MEGLYVVPHDQELMSVVTKLFGYYICSECHYRFFGSSTLIMRVIAGLLVQHTGNEYYRRWFSFLMMSIVVGSVHS